MDERTLFISSCNRRELARRRGQRTLISIQVLLIAMTIVIALGAFVAAHGGL